LIEEYVKTGKVRLEYRDFIVFGAESRLIAEAAACAAEQGAFWRYHDTIFANQALQGQGVFAPAGLKRLAADLGLDSAAFATCLDSGRHAEEIETMSETGRSQGVSGTPAIFVNGTRVAAWDFGSLSKAIEAASTAAAPAAEEVGT
jgi:protein-disulfide isomerase